MKKTMLALACAFAGVLLAEAHTVKFMTDWKNPTVVKTDSTLVCPHPKNLNGHMFAGWLDPKTKKHYQK